MKKVSYKIPGYFDWSRTDVFQSCDVIIAGIMQQCSVALLLLAENWFSWYLLLLLVV